MAEPPFLNQPVSEKNSTRRRGQPWSCSGVGIDEVKMVTQQATREADECHWMHMCG